MEFKSINNIFENRLFRIPDYQRGYAWRSDKEVVAFWNDLMNLQKGKSHFTGSLTLQKMSEGEKKNLEANWLLENDYTPWLVVDGQQRHILENLLKHSVRSSFAGKKRVN